jgi:hypothetical protein
MADTAIAITRAAPQVFGFGSAGNTSTAPKVAALHLDLSDGGPAWLSGTVKKDATPDDLPLRRRVRLYEGNCRRFVRETWSDAATGAFSFSNLNPDQQYTAIVYDHLGQYRALISDGQIAGA